MNKARNQNLKVCLDKSTDIHGRFFIQLRNEIELNSIPMENQLEEEFDCLSRVME